MSMSKYAQVPEGLNRSLGGPAVSSAKAGLLDNYRVALNEINNDLIMSMSVLQDNLGRLMGGYPSPPEEAKVDRPPSSDCCGKLSNEIDNTRRIAQRIAELINRVGEL